jgi:sec-independent protein translocase protein TatA
MGDPPGMTERKNQSNWQQVGAIMSLLTKGFYLLEARMNLGPTELIIILVIVLLLFGVGRLSKIGGELGRGIREFRSGLKDDDAAKGSSEKDTTDEPEKTQVG